MTRVEVERVDPAEALRRIRARLVAHCGYPRLEWGSYARAVAIIDEEWPDALRDE